MIYSALLSVAMIVCIDAPAYDTYPGYPIIPLEIAYPGNGPLSSDQLVMAFDLFAIMAFVPPPYQPVASVMDSVFMNVTILPWMDYINPILPPLPNWLEPLNGTPIPLPFDEGLMDEYEFPLE